MSHDTLVEERRFALLYVHDNAMLRWANAICEKGRTVPVKYDGLPADISVARIYYDPGKQSQVWVCVSRLYSPVPLGRPIPEIKNAVIEFATISPNTRIQIEGTLTKPHAIKVSGLVSQRLWQPFLTATTPDGWVPEEPEEQEKTVKKKQKQ